MLLANVAAMVPIVFLFLLPHSAPLSSNAMNKRKKKSFPEKKSLSVNATVDNYQNWKKNYAKDGGLPINLCSRIFMCVSMIVQACF